MLLENGADPSYMQHRLGHKDVTVTLKVYKHLTEKMTERGVEVFGIVVNIHTNIIV